MPAISRSRRCGWAYRRLDEGGRTIRRAEQWVNGGAGRWVSGQAEQRVDGEAGRWASGRAEQQKHGGVGGLARSAKPNCKLCVSV